MSQNVIHKITLEFDGEGIEQGLRHLPANAKILALQLQNGLPTIWYLRPLDLGPPTVRTFVWFFTGVPFTTNRTLVYIGTIQSFGMVLHLFELT